MKNTIDLLIEILVDEHATIAERDEAAIELCEFTDPKSIDALISRAKDYNENELVLNSCGESLGTIWVKINQFDQITYHELTNIARYGIYVVIKSRKPAWVEKYNLGKDRF
jgi:hypothetical protein